MTFHPWTFLFQLCNFVVLVYILKRLLYRPLREAIEQRQQAQAAARAAAEKAHCEAEALQGQLREQLAKTERERQQVLQQAREQAEAQRKDLIARAEQELEEKRQVARQALERDRREAKQALRGELTGLALDLVQRLLREAANSTLQEQLCRRLMDKLRELPDRERSELRRDWQSGDDARLESVAELEPGTVADLAQLLQGLLGQPVNIRLGSRPELIAGVRLHLGGHVWDASLGACLNQARSHEEAA